MQAKNVCVRGQLVTQHFLFSFNILSFPVLVLFQYYLINDFFVFFLVCVFFCDPIYDPIRDPVRDAVCDPVRDPIRDPICDPVRDLVHDLVRDTICDPVRDLVRDLVHFDPGFVNTGLHIVKAHKWFWTGNDPRTANDPKIVL